MARSGCRHPSGHPSARHLAAVVGLLTLLTAPAASALPPQGIAVVGWAMLWCVLVAANAALLAARFIPGWLRLCLVIMLLTGGMYASFVWGQGERAPGGLGNRVDYALYVSGRQGADLAPEGEYTLPSIQALAPPELSPAAVPEEVTSPAKALTMAARKAVLWIDLRRTANFASGHIEGAHNVPLLEAQSFDMVHDLGWILDPSRRPSVAPGGMPAIESVTRVESLVAATRPDHVIVYCNGGLTSSYVAHALTTRGISASRVPGGFYALESLGARVTALDDGGLDTTLYQSDLHALAHRITVVEHTPTRAQNLEWARLPGPPPNTHPPGDDVVILLRHDAFSDTLTARWSRALWRDWGYPLVVLADLRPTQQHKTAGLDTLLAVERAFGARWWLVAWIVSLLLAITTTHIAIRRRLAARQAGALSLSATIAQTLLVLGVAHVAGTAEAFPWLGLLEITPLVHLLGLLTLAGAVALRARESARARSFRLLSSVRHARDEARVGPGAPPWRAGHWLMGLLVAAVAGSLSTPTLLVTVTALITGPTLWHLRARRLSRRLQAAPSDDEALTILLRAAGIEATHEAPQGALSSASEQPGWGIWRPADAEPIAWPLFAATEAEVPAMDAARQVTLVAARPVTLEGGRWLVVAEPDAVAGEVISASAALCDVGVAAKDLGEATLSRARLAEAVERPSELALELLRARGSEHGAAGHAARRFGARLRPAPMVKIGGRPYEALAPATRPAGRPGWLARLVAKTTILTAPMTWRVRVVPEALGRLGALSNGATTRPLRRMLRALWREGAFWPELIARSAQVAELEVAHRAHREGVPAFPPPPSPAPPHQGVGGSYELRPDGERRERSAIEVQPLPRAEALAYGPGSRSLQAWRGRARAAGWAREAARGLVLAQMRTLGDAMTTTPGVPPDLFERSLGDADRILSGKAPGGHSRTEGGTSGSLPDAVLLRELGAPAPGACEGALSGSLVAGEPLRSGTVRHDRGTLSGPEDVLVVARLTPELVTELPPLGAIIAERGSPLSHAVVLARERGLTTVIRARGACEGLAEGCLVSITASGEVRVIEEG